MNQPEPCLATEADIPELADILADAFADDEVMSWVMGGPTSARVFEKMIRLTYMPKGECWWVPGQAAALWVPGDAIHAETLFDAMKLLPAMIANGGLKTVWRGLQADGILGDVHPKTPHQYLFAIGVRSSAQGKGLGKKIMAPMLEYCDAQGVDAYLENSKPKNNNFYRGLGYDFMGEPVAVGKGAPTLRPMLRTPRV